MVGRNNTFMTKKVPKIVVFITHSNCFQKPTIFNHFVKLEEHMPGNNKKSCKNPKKPLQPTGQDTCLSCTLSLYFPLFALLHD